IEALPVHHLFASLLEHLPPTLFLILASRSEPPLPLARLRVRGQLVELRTPDLRFTDEEAAQFLNERMGLSLAPAAAARLARRGRPGAGRPACNGPPSRCRATPIPASSSIRSRAATVTSSTICARRCFGDSRRRSSRFCCRPQSWSVSAGRCVRRSPVWQAGR